MIQRGLLLLVLLGTLVGAASAKEKAAHTRAADSAIEAFDEDRLAELKELAGRSQPDPWEVADELLARGRIDVARAFATAAPRFDVEGLSAWLTEAAKHGPDPKAREAFAAAVQRFRAQEIAEAVAAFLAIDPGWPSVTSMLALGEVPFLQARLGRFDAALKTAVRGAARAHAMGWNSMEISMQELQGRLLVQLDRPAEARVPFAAALSRAKRLQDPSVADNLLLEIARVHSRLGEFEDAIRQLEEAVRRLEGRTSPTLVRAHLGLGNAWAELENRPQALAAYEVAKSLATKLRLGHLLADALTNMAIELSAMGDPGSALVPLRAALALGAAQRAPASVASSYHALASLHWRMGRPAEALDALERSLPYARKSQDAVALVTAELTQAEYLAELGQGEARRERIEAVLALASRRRINPVLHAQVLQSMAEVLEADGDREGARSNYQRAVALLRAHERTSALADARENLALFDHRTGRAENSVARLRALIAEREASKRPAAAASTRLNLAQLLMATDREEARRQLDRAMELAVAVEDALLRRSIHIARADWHMRAKQWPEALVDVKQARLLARTSTRGLAELHGAAARERRRSAFELGLGVAFEMGDVDEALAFLESGRADGLLQGLAGREAVRAATLPPDLVKAESLARARENAAQHAVRRARGRGSRKTARAARKALRAARAEREALVARLDRAARRTSDIVDVEPASRAALEASLAATEVLVLYGTTPGRFVALRVTAKGTRLLDLGPRKAIEGLARVFDALTAGSDLAASVAELRRLVVDPLRLEAAYTRVLVSSAAALAYVPLALLMPDRDLVHVPSGTTRLLLQGEGAARGLGVLGIGDPDYGHRPVSANRVRGASLMPLPGTRVEIEAVADVRLLAREATEQGLRAALKRRKRWRSVHFACHGLVDAEHPMRSALAVTAGPEDDGYITALDIMRMRIPADVAVLSACETGRGKVFHSEGVVGLTRAFMFAGAPRVICSLWKVDDEATRALMIKLYELWDPKSGQGLPLVSALRAAQAYVRAQPKWSHPYYWAAWQLWGLGD